jgi:DNA-binding transcriptional regulator YhcF (GntR family)
LNEFWTQLFVDRESQVPPVRQISDAIRHAIATNRLQGGEALLSVRQLAALLEVTPATVGRAFSLLRAEGLLRSKTGSATVVADITNVDGAAQERAKAVARGIVDRAIDTVVGMGLSIRQIRAIADRKLTQLEASRNVIFVAGARPVVDKYHGIVEAAVGPAGYSVHSYTVAELSHPAPEQLAILNSAVRLICLLSFKQTVEATLRSAGLSVPVSVLLTEITIGTSAKLASLSSDETVLVVAEPEYRNSAVGLVRYYVPDERIVIATELDRESLLACFERVDIVVHTLGCSMLIGPAGEVGKKVIQLEYYPRADAIERIVATLGEPDLRQGLTDPAPGSAAKETSSIRNVEVS